MTRGAERTPLHLRRVHVEGFERPDGLIDLEGTIIDTKPFEIEMLEKTAAPGDAIHHMTLRLAIDLDFNIREAEARTVTAPYGICGRIAPSYERLVGLRIGPGFNTAAKRLFRGIEGCTHMSELLPVMATVAYQVVWSRPNAFGREGERHTALGGCHALRVDGPIVAKYFPHAARQALPPAQDKESPSQEQP